MGLEGRDFTYNERITISRKRHFRSPKRKNENTLQYKVPPKTWENSPQKPILAIRKWFFGHCYVQKYFFLTRTPTKYLNSYIFWTGSSRRFWKGRTLVWDSQLHLGCLQHHCGECRCSMFQCILCKVQSLSARVGAQHEVITAKLYIIT